MLRIFSSTPCVVVSSTPTSERRKPVGSFSRPRKTAGTCWHQRRVGIQHAQLADRAAATRPAASRASAAATASDRSSRTAEPRSAGPCRGRGEMEGAPRRRDRRDPRSPRWRCCARARLSPAIAQDRVARGLCPLVVTASASITAPRGKIDVDLRAQPAAAAPVSGESSAGVSSTLSDSRATRLSLESSSHKSIVGRKPQLAVRRSPTSFGPALQLGLRTGDEIDRVRLAVEDEDRPACVAIARSRTEQDDAIGVVGRQAPRAPARIVVPVRTRRARPFRSAASTAPAGRAPPARRDGVPRATVASCNGRPQVRRDGVQLLRPRLAIEVQQPPCRRRGVSSRSHTPSRAVAREIADLDRGRGRLESRRSTTSVFRQRVAVVAPDDGRIDVERPERVTIEHPSRRVRERARSTSRAAVTFRRATARRSSAMAAAGVEPPERTLGRGRRRPVRPGPSSATRRGPSTPNRAIGCSVPSRRDVEAVQRGTAATGRPS